MRTTVACLAIFLVTTGVAADNGGRAPAVISVTPHELLYDTDAAYARLIEPKPFPERLIVRGRGFRRGAVVLANGAAITTRFRSATRLEARTRDALKTTRAVESDESGRRSYALITVRNPGRHKAASNGVRLIICRQGNAGG